MRESEDKSIELSRNPCHHNSGLSLFVVRPDRAQIHGWGVARSKPVLLLSSNVGDFRKIPKKTKVGDAFSKTCSGTPPVGVVHPQGGFPNFVLRKECSGTPPGGATRCTLHSLGADRPSGQSAPLPSASALGRSWLPPAPSERFRVRSLSHPSG